MQETRYVNQDGVCQMSRVQDGDSVWTMGTVYGRCGRALT